MSSKHIAFVTSSNLATNPRCVKEINLAVDLGFTVSIVKFDYGNWSGAIDQNLISALPGVKVYSLSGNREPIVPFLISTLISQVCKILIHIFTSKTVIIAFALDKRSWVLYRFFKKCNIRPAIIVAHNPATFWPVKFYAKNAGINYAIDVEDFHPGEFTQTGEQQIMLNLLRATLPQASYVSFASPLIMDKSLKAVPDIASPMIINNCFSQEEFRPPTVVSNNKLQIVWYSQNIDFGRGLEKVVPLFKPYSGEVGITLIGNLRPKFATFLTAYHEFVSCLSPMPQQQLHSFLATCHVGLAIEDDSKDENRSWCLTNKIWSYFQAGLFLIASDTIAQAQFMSVHIHHGILCHIGDAKSVQIAIDSVLADKENIINQAKARYEAAGDFSWEKENINLQQYWPV